MPDPRRTRITAPIADRRPHQPLEDELAAQQPLVDATRESSGLSQARYRTGIDSHPRVLDPRRSFCAAQQGLITTRPAHSGDPATLRNLPGGGGTTG